MTREGPEINSKLDELSPHPVMLAPMVGLTHYAVRRGVQHFLPAGARVLWPTEMLNSRRIPSQHPSETPEVNFEDREWGLCPQLLANEEEFIRRSVPKLELWGARAIDINMGCPVQKALKHNYGVALMGDPVYAREVVRMTVANASVPVSVKLRAGLEGQDFQYLIDFISGLFEAGAAWITVHPRTAAQMRKGVADWSLIKKIKDHFKSSGQVIQVVGNGDVQCHEDIEQMFEQAQCDRVMIGRAAIVKPWLIRNEAEPDAYTQGAWYGEFLKKVLEETREHYELEAGKKRMKFLIVYGKPYVEYGEYLYGRVMAATTFEQLETAFENFFNQKQKIIKRTELRH